jgi:hypothetical protein
MRAAALIAVAATLTLFAFVVVTPRQQDVRIGMIASGDMQVVDDTDSDDDDSAAQLAQEEDDEQAQQQVQQDLQNMIDSEQEAEQLASQ